MNKLEFLALLAYKLKDLEDTDEVVIEQDGGDYWGTYHNNFTIEVTQPAPDEYTVIGHPGGNARFEQIKKLAIIKGL